ncbi:tRNA adenosine(34) deaminase TadA [Lawsonia intracellularis]|nr:tRNA adenosine(34) deaminase TadA [Lawsonia intracellularis]AGC49756.1 cytosine/adenosine deaminase [Lawsonia intracellularis N343]UYH53268.1 tRNA adenosine(34) deaminase TadA [Lawsonia intracellularis]
MDYKPEKIMCWGPIPTPPLGWTWDNLMDEALIEANQCTKKNEVPVGAIIVHKNGKIIGKGHNAPITTSDPTAHAEILALRTAGAVQQNYRLQDCFLIVTLEPCLMCVGAIIQARIDGIVYGAAELNTGSITSCIAGFDLPFNNYKPWHMGGIKATQCSQLLHNFFYKLRK